MTRLKSALSYWYVIAIVGGILTVGWGGHEVVASKVDVATFDPFAKDIEKRVTVGEVHDEFTREDIKLIKEQMRYIAVATGSRVVIPAPDGGVK